LRDGDRVCRPGIDFVLPERECSPCEALDAAFARSNNAVFVQARGEQLRHLRASLRKRARSSISKHVSVLRNPTETEMRGYCDPTDLIVRFFRLHQTSGSFLKLKPRSPA
jgi:hypothetical protein